MFSTGAAWLFVTFILTDPPALTAPPPRPIACRYSCVCYRENTYRCFRWYTQACRGKECWQCQLAVTRKARKSCSLGSRIKVCYCKGTKLRKKPFDYEDPEAQTWQNSSQKRVTCADPGKRLSSPHGG